MKLYFLFFTCLLIANRCLAQICQNVNGTATEINYDLSTTLSAAQNQPGQTVQLAKSQEVNVQAVCPAGSSPTGRTYRSYTTPFAVVETSGRWKYLKLDPDYLEGAMEIQDSAAGAVYPPINYAYMGYDENVNNGNPFYIRDSNLLFQIKIVRSFIGTVVIPTKDMFSVYVTTTQNDPLSTVVYHITYSGSVTVPQSCEINAGQTLLIDFGTLNSGSFKHAGEKPEGARTRSFNVPVKCNGTTSQVHLSMRVQATPDTHFSQSIASDNPDVGVVVTNNQGSILTPDDPNSTVPFTTDDTGNATIPLQAYPVSTTGITPEEGTFTSLASIRVDFD
ncbi:fimbrial protein [Superficieibacter electus]|uniref:Fimbrial protein n=1 Tax=Superficieibacter electus TaxID=2022662 RepID=A0A2P5GJD8_9ENTR|nr:fimbrial protein [Superficieibacter electus]POP41352.1 fimbrial protein [Superficieibacter electus]POP43750.1 fimbrial protein [Superficieibacter electus]